LYQIDAHDGAKEDCVYFNPLSFLGRKSRKNTLHFLVHDGRTENGAGVVWQFFASLLGPALQRLAGGRKVIVLDFSYIIFGVIVGQCSQRREMSKTRTIAD
jgi:hypothetical protein